eukprot:8391283-Pyramimonas_sp.AAC.1
MPPPRSPCQKPLRSDRGASAQDPNVGATCPLFLQGVVGVLLDCAQQTLCRPPTLPFKNHCKMVAGSPRMLQNWRQN